MKELGGRVAHLGVHLKELGGRVAHLGVHSEGAERQGGSPGGAR